MKFSDFVWQQVAPIYQRIVNHPFNVELAKGTLDRERFIFYMEQDAYYLVSYSRALALIASRADCSENMSHFLNFALGALITERELHVSFLTPNATYDQIEPSPACMAYTRYLIATAATASMEEAIAAILPCFWIYREVGRNIVANAKETNPYISWIKTYSSKEFSSGTEKAIAILNEIANDCSTQTLERMKNSFEYSALFEWHFWDDAYKMVTFRKAYNNGFSRTSEIEQFMKRNLTAEQLSLSVPERI